MTRHIFNILDALRWLPFAVFAIAAAQIAVWSIDRDPTFKITSVEPQFGIAGAPVVLTAGVQRDISRRCDANLTRYLVDNTGARWEIDGPVHLSYWAILSAQKRSPGHITVALNIPSDAAPGPATLISSVENHCNPLHRLWPIESMTEIPFTIVSSLRALAVD